MNDYIEITVDPNEYFDAITGRMQWRKLWICLMRRSYMTLEQEIPNITWEEIYHKTIALRRSIFNDLKKYYRKNKKLYIITISVKR